MISFLRHSHFLLAVTIAIAGSFLVHADTAQHTFDANGRLYQVISTNWTTTYFYDGAGNVTNFVRIDKGPGTHLIPLELSTDKAERVSIFCEKNGFPLPRE